MLKFTEHLEQSPSKKLFTDAAINELKSLVREEAQEVVTKNVNPKVRQEVVSTFSNPEPTVVKPNINLDVTAPAKLINVDPIVDKKNLFSLPSIITVSFFIISTIYVDYDAALEDGRISRRERLKIFYLLFGAVATLVSRGSEGASKPYVPKWIPGPHLKDMDGDNDIDEEDERLWNKKYGKK